MRAPRGMLLAPALVFVLCCCRGADLLVSVFDAGVSRRPVMIAQTFIPFLSSLQTSIAVDETSNIVPPTQVSAQQEGLGGGGHDHAAHDPDLKPMAICDDGGASLLHSSIPSPSSVFQCPSGCYPRASQQLVVVIHLMWYAVVHSGITLCIGGERRIITGVNYFGFEVAWGTMVDGIFHGPTALTIGAHAADICRRCFRTIQREVAS